MRSLTPAGPISRRMVLASGLCALLPLRPAAAATPGQLAFDALLDGRKVGEQHMTFDRGDDLTVRSELDITVKLGPVTLYRYHHEATERWRDGRFRSLDTQTADNGKRLQVSARREDSVVIIAPAAGAPVRAAANALPFTHWNRAIAAAPLFNPQDGKLLREMVAAPASGSVVLADGTRQRAQGVSFSGDAEIEDWYDGDGVWTGLVGHLKGGSVMEYRRL